jgi:predicted enzyme involved in methoxymalonyl-ACP biosynthesis
MISVIICKQDASVWEIDTWLMSCRVLGRRVELAALQEIINQAQRFGASKLLGTYIATPRNIIVKDHYKKLGFKKVFSDEVIETWELDIIDYTFQELPIKFK